MNRKAAVAGTFYPGSAPALEKLIAGMVNDAAPKTEAVGVVSPHAGYTYSGPVAGATISRIKFEDSFVILGPNHTGMGAPFSLWSGDAWETPLGSVAVDYDLRQKLLADTRYFTADTGAHFREHSIEVQLPFLQHFKKDVKIVPIVLGGGTPRDYDAMGREIARAILSSGRRAVVLASSDMTHYEPQASAERKDNLAIQAILKLDAKSLFDRVTEYNISMCGYAPALVMLAAARALGATSGELVRYQTSGDTSGDFNSVVGYAGIIIKRG
jgi:AmmeMemoRadiSam system protein B